MSEPVERRLTRADWPARTCPMRDEHSPEYRLLITTIREEIANAMENATSNKRALLYSRLNLILMAGAIAGALVKWH